MSQWAVQLKQSRCLLFLWQSQSRRLKLSLFAAGGKQRANFALSSPHCRETISSNGGGDTGSLIDTRKNALSCAAPTAGLSSRLGGDADKCVRNLWESLLKEIGCLKIERILWEGAANLVGGGGQKQSVRACARASERACACVCVGWSSFIKERRRRNFTRLRREHRVCRQDQFEAMWTRHDGGLTERVCVCVYSHRKWFKPTETKAVE